MKAKLFQSPYMKVLQREINEFIVKHSIYDIQFNVSGSDSSNRIWCAMIIYKDPGDE